MREKPASEMEDGSVDGKTEVSKDAGDQVLRPVASQEVSTSENPAN